MDVCRYVGTGYMCFWSNSNVRQKVRWVRCPPDWPHLPFLHSFTRYINSFDDWYTEPGQGGVVGESVNGIKRGKDTPPPLTFNPTHACGDPVKWVNGFTLGVDAPLVWTDFEYSTCCLDGQPHPGFRAGGVKVGGGAAFPIVPRGGSRTGGASAFAAVVSSGGSKTGGKASF